MTALSDFHAHLDNCALCRGHPFALCEEGRRLLRLATIEQPITRYECGNHCEVTGQPAPPECMHGFPQVKHG